MKNLFRTGIILFLALLTASCGNKLVTESLKPSNTNTSEYITMDWSKKVYCGLDTNAMNPGTPKQNELWVGYKRFYRPGTEPFPCWDWANAVYRGAFKFDLGKFMGKKIVTAILNLSLGQAQYVSGTLASNEGDWVKTLGLATSEWWLKPSPYVVPSNGASFPWKAIPGMPDLPHGAKPAVQANFPIKYNGANYYQIDVTNVVRDWVDGKEPNMGLMLIGTNEKSVAKSHDEAVSPVNGIKLDITYSIPK